MLSYYEIANDCNDEEWLQFLVEAFPHIDFTLQKLMNEADESARWRGHSLAWTKQSPDRAEGVCLCGMHVVCLTKPQPNQINIGGSAVALNCRREDNAPAVKGPCILHLTKNRSEE